MRPLPPTRPLPHLAPAAHTPLLRHLSPRDHRLFSAFGQGPVVPLPHTLVHSAIERWATDTPHSVAAEHEGANVT